MKRDMDPIGDLLVGDLLVAIEEAWRRASCPAGLSGAGAGGAARRIFPWTRNDRDRTVRAILVMCTANVYRIEAVSFRASDDFPGVGFNRRIPVRCGLKYASTNGISSDRSDETPA